MALTFDKPEAINAAYDAIADVQVAVQEQLYQEALAEFHAKSEAEQAFLRSYQEKHGAPVWSREHNPLIHYGNRGMAPEGRQIDPVQVAENVTRTGKEIVYVVRDVIREPVEPQTVAYVAQPEPLPQPVDDGGIAVWPWVLAGSCLTPIIIVICLFAVWKTFFSGESPGQNRNNVPSMNPERGGA